MIQLLYSLMDTKINGWIHSYHNTPSLPSWLEELGVNRNDDDMFFVDIESEWFVEVVYYCI